MASAATVPATMSSSAPMDAGATASYADQVAATTFKRLHPTAYLSRFLSSQVREDARSLTQFRPVTISLGSVSTAHGSCFVKIDNTVCIAAVKAEVAVPPLERPGEGYIIPNVELPALSSTRFKPGPPGNEAQVLTAALLSFLTASDLLDRSTLAIEPGAAVWCLYLDITFLSYDGNAIDAAVLAALGALRHTTLPLALHDHETGETCQKSATETTKLDVRGWPLCASFGTFDGTYLLADPSSFESSLLGSHLTIGLRSPSRSTPSNPTICYLSQAGSLRTGPNASDAQNLDLCIALATTRCAELRTALEEAERTAA